MIVVKMFKARKITIYKIINIAYITLACLGLIYQVVIYSAHYLKYHVATKTELLADLQQTWMTMDYCAFQDMMTRNSSEITISDIFDKTPSISDIIGACSVRDGDSYIVNMYNSSQCHELFDVIKFIYGECICYRFQPKHKTRYKTIHIWESKSYATKFYQIFIQENSILNHAKLLKIIMSLARDKEFPYLTNYYTTFFSTGYNEIKNHTEINFVKSYFKYLKTENLEAPYETDCYHYDKSYEHCLYDCIDQESKKHFHAIPPVVAVFDKSNYRFMENNMTTSKIVDSIHDYCKDNICKKRACEVHVTPTINSAYRWGGNSFVLAPCTSNEPDRIVTSYAALRFDDFLILVSSCFGSWLGVSILSLNPFKDKSHMKNNNAIKNSRIVAIETFLKKLDRRTILMSRRK